MNKRGQSIVEYGLIAILVIFGIVYMGPYLLRSINAHFKLWDEGVHDSFQENIKQAPLNSVPPINVTCACQTDYSSGCGTPNLGVSQCPANELNMNTNCNPPGCDGRPLSYCSAPVDSCCQTYYPAGCGNVAPSALPQSTTTSTVPPSGTNGLGSSGTSYVVGCSKDSDCPSGISCTSGQCSSFCLYGQRIWATQCSDLNATCITDPVNCPITCSGSALYPGSAAPCPAQPPQDGTALDQPYLTHFVDEQDPSGCNSAAYNCTQDSDCNPGATCSGGKCSCTSCSAPCQQYCLAPYTLNHKTNVCQFEFKVAPSSGPHIVAGTNVYYPHGCKKTAVAGQGGCGGLSDCTEYQWDCSFQMCVDPNTTITSAYIVSAGAAGTCGNTAGFKAGAICAISVNN